VLNKGIVELIVDVRVKELMNEREGRKYKNSEIRVHFLKKNGA
jgi:hypothetical protein